MLDPAPTPDDSSSRGPPASARTLRVQSFQGPQEEPQEPLKLPERIREETPAAQSPFLNHGDRAESVDEQNGPLVPAHATSVKAPRSAEEERLLKEIRALARQVNTLGSQLTESQDALALERSLRKREEEYGTQTIKDLRAEVQRQAERARSAERTLSRIEVERIEPLQRDAQTLVEALPILDLVESFVGTQLHACCIKAPRVPKAETVAQRVQRLSQGIESISAAWQGSREKLKERGLRIEEMKETLKQQTLQIERLEETLRTERAGNAQVIEKVRRELADVRRAQEASSTQIARLSAELHNAQEAKSMLQREVAELQERLSARNKWRELNEALRRERDHLLTEMLKLRDQQSSPPPAPVPTSNPLVDPEKILTLAPTELSDALERLLSENSSRAAFFDELVRKPTRAQLLKDALDAARNATDALGDDEAILEDPRFLALEAASACLTKETAAAIDRNKAFAFLLALDPDDASIIVSECSADTVRELMGFAAVRSDWSHALGTSKSLSVIDELPTLTRAAVIELCDQDERALLMLFGSSAIRAGVKQLGKLFAEAWGAKTDAKTPEAFARKRALAAAHSADPLIAAAQNALSAYGLLSQERTERLWATFPPTQPGIAAATTSLGFEIRDALALAGLQVNVQ